MKFYFSFLLVLLLFVPREWEKERGKDTANKVFYSNLAETVDETTGIIHIPSPRHTFIFIYFAHKIDSHHFVFIFLCVLTSVSLLSVSGLFFSVSHSHSFTFYHQFWWRCLWLHSKHSFFCVLFLAVSVVFLRWIYVFHDEWSFSNECKWL